MKSQSDDVTIKNIVWHFLYDPDKKEHYAALWTRKAVIAALKRKRAPIRTVSLTRSTPARQINSHVIELVGTGRTLEFIRI